MAEIEIQRLRYPDEGIVTDYPTKRVSSIKDEGLSRSQETDDRVALEDVKVGIPNSAYKGLYCVLNHAGEILEANDRLKVLAENCQPNKSRSAKYGPNIFDYVPKGSKLPLYERLQEFIATTTSEDSVIHLDIPLSVANFHVKVRAQVKLHNRSVVLLVSDKELDSVRNVELVKIKAMVTKKSNMGVWVVDEQNIVRDVLGVNCESNLGFKAAEVIGMNILSYVDVGDHEEALRKAGEEEHDKPYYIRRVHQSGISIRTKIVQGRITLHDGKEYTMFLDTYESSESELG